jgi:predicted RNA-binding Zn-ribbon protein involved in translation (DUF1610 family)
MTMHNTTEADIRRRALDYDCPTCGRAAGKRCAMLRADGTHTAGHRAPTNCHAERNSVAAPSFGAHDFRHAVDRLGARQRFIRAGRPNSNGCVERAQLTILEECWRPAFARSLVPKITALAQDLDAYLIEYNYDRAHTGRVTQGRVPADIVDGARKTSPGR